MPAAKLTIKVQHLSISCEVDNNRGRVVTFGMERERLGEPWHGTQTYTTVVHELTRWLGMNAQDAEQLYDDALSFANLELADQLGGV